MNKNQNKTNLYYGAETSNKKTISFAKASEYVSEIRIPQKMVQGQEYSIGKASIVFTRRKSRVKEFFSWPFGYVTTRLKIQYHWDGIEVVGSNMEKPNLFIFPFPDKVEQEAGWILKTICKTNCSIGYKPLYMSIDTIHENVIAKLFANLIKLLSLLVLLSILIALITSIFYKDETTMTNFMQFLQNNVNLPPVSTLSPITFFFIILLIFWDKIDKIFESFTKERPLPTSINETGEGNKILGFGITVEKRG